jgi:two-component system response regulator PilR (NtrC family)
MPPLRERHEDVAPLAGGLAGAHLRRASAASGAASLACVLENYSFPGNVRELENILERATALCSGNAVAR